MFILSKLQLAKRPTAPVQFRDAPVHDGPMPASQLKTGLKFRFRSFDIRESTRRVAISEIQFSGALEMPSHVHRTRGEVRAMSTLTNRRSIAMALVLGIALSVPLSAAALSDPAPSALPSRPSTPFQVGELVRMRSGGPMMTVDSIVGSQVDCYWTNLDGIPISERFPAAVLQKF